MGPPSAVARLPREPGVYRFRDARGQVLYVGRATTLRSRVASYWSDLRDRRHLAPMVARVARVEAVACGSAHEAAWLERNLLEQALPQWNRTPGGQESEVYIRLDTRPAAPGLTVVHVRQHTAGAEHFGPYLGGQRVRQAVSGLGRIRPLGYSGALTGSRLDIARARGFSAADPARLASDLTAILRREPAAAAAARADLERLRDRASQALGFELAGRIQDEIQALAWLTCPQRVTVADGGDLDVYGWADGMLVCFGVRGGRLCRWSQRGCGEHRAAAHLAATPPAWAAFAQHNAELAAALAAPA